MTPTTSTPAPAPVATDAPSGRASCAPRSLAAAVAARALVTVILPAEYRHRPDGHRPGGRASIARPPRPPSRCPRAPPARRRRGAAGGGLALQERHARIAATRCRSRWRRARAPRSRRNGRRRAAACSRGPSSGGGVDVDMHGESARQDRRRSQLLDRRVRAAAATARSKRRWPAITAGSGRT